MSVMIKQYKVYLFWFFVLFLASCGDESPEPTNSITANSQSFVVLNNPNPNIIIGTVIATSSSNQPLTYSIESETVTGALSIGTNNGRLSVANASAFNYDLNPAMSAVIRVSSGSISKDVNVFINMDQLDAFDISAIEYFKDVALGFEFGNASQITRKWKSDVKIFVDGDFSSDLETELNRIVTELNGLFSDGFSIEIVQDVSESNHFIFFGTGEDYAALYPSQANFVTNNFGLFSIYWNNLSELNRAHMYVDTERANLAAQKHLLREELTQSLGLARDSEEYPTSIFQARWTTTNEFAEIDKALIRMLYSSEMVIGLDASNVEPFLRQILENDK